MNKKNASLDNSEEQSLNCARIVGVINCVIVIAPIILSAIAAAKDGHIFMFIFGTPLMCALFAGFLFVLSFVEVFGTPTTRTAGIASGYMGLIFALRVLGSAWCTDFEESLMEYKAIAVFHNVAYYVIIPLGVLLIVALIIDKFRSDKIWEKTQGVLNPGSSAYRQYVSGVRRASKAYKSLPVEEINPEPLFAALDEFKTDSKTDRIFHDARQKLVSETLPDARKAVHDAAVVRKNQMESGAFFLLQTENDWPSYQAYFDDTRLNLEDTESLRMNYQR